MASDPLEVAKACTAALTAAAEEVDRLAAQRRAAVRDLLDGGWSMQRLADELGVSKSAVQKMAR